MGKSPAHVAVTLPRKEALVAALELRNKTYRVVFMYAGKKYAYSLDTGQSDMAEALRGGVERTLMLLTQGLLRLPEGADLIAFVKAGGKVEEPSPPLAERLKLKTLTDGYLASHANGAMEENSLATVRMHLGHFTATLGERFDVQALTLEDLQRHVDTRAKKRPRGRRLSPVTLRKEMATFRACWNWGVHGGKLKGHFPSRGLKYPKGEEKPPFQTWDEIERRIALGGLTEREQQELWDCLFLTLSEIADLLAFVKENAAHPWVYPAFCFAAHTGARRSEILRLKTFDVDFAGETVIIHEKKRSRGKRTTRRAPLSPFLAGVLKEWLAIHPGGQDLFCHAGEVFRSKKRSRTTGYQNDKVRPSSLEGRLASVRRRDRPAQAALTKDEAHDHFQRTLGGGKWKVLKGWHVLRHSFISNCAAKGVDQRLIDDWVGHTTAEVRKRYRHLVPSVEKTAIRSVFG
jgi:integrase